MPTHQSSGLSSELSWVSASGVSSPVLGSTSARPGMSSISTSTSLPSMLYRQKSCCGSMVGRYGSDWKVCATILRAMLDFPASRAPRKHTLYT